MVVFLFKLATQTRCSTVNGNRRAGVENPTFQSTIIKDSDLVKDKIAPCTLTGKKTNIIKTSQCEARSLMQLPVGQK